MLWGAEKLVPAEYWCPLRYLLNFEVLQVKVLKYDHFVQT